MVYSLQRLSLDRGIETQPLGLLLWYQMSCKGCPSVEGLKLTNATKAITVKVELQRLSLDRGIETRLNRPIQIYHLSCKGCPSIEGLKRSKDTNHSPVGLTFSCKGCPSIEGLKPLFVIRGQGVVPSCKGCPSIDVLKLRRVIYFRQRSRFAKTPHQ